MFHCNRSSITRPGLAIVLAGICLTSTVFGCLQAQEKTAVPPQTIHVYVHPKKLTAQDKLQDHDTVIEIKGETTLIWVDLRPDARFTHPAEYILISAEGTRVVRGGWWPTLNGEALFRDGKTNMIASLQDLRSIER